MENKLTKKTMHLWQIRITAAALIFAAVFFALTEYGAYFYIPFFVCLLAGLVADVWYLPRFFCSYSVFVGENAVIVEHGVFVKTAHIMPYKRLVFAGSYMTPLGRLFGLKGIVLRAARANLIIAEIDEDGANRLLYGLCGEKQND